MFRQWLAIFKKDTLLDRAFKRSYEMLDLTREMFLKSTESLRQKEDSEIDINLKDQDLEVNKYEREVRRDVFSHLVVSGAESLPSGFILVSIIIDIERIGDFTKNIVELAIEHPGKLHGGMFEEDIHRIEEDVAEHFTKTKVCFETSNVQEGLKVLEKFFWINKTCDRILYSLVKGEDKEISSGDAVALALYVRWLKRINSHLRNITTSVVNSFDRIGFEPEDE